MASPLDDLRKPRPSALRGLLATPDPEIAAQSNQMRLDETSSLARGVAAGAYGMSSGSFAADALQAELEGKAQEASALRQQALEQATLAQQRGPTIASYKDVRSLGDAGSYAAGALGQAAPTMLPSIAAAALTRGRLRYPAALAPAYLLERNEAIGTQLQDPVAMQRSAQERLDTARVKGLAGGALEALVPAGLVGAFGHAGKGALRTLATNAIEEGLTETAQQKVGQLAQSYLNPNRDTSHDTTELIDAGLQGAIGGGGMALPTAGSQAVANQVQAAGQKAKELGTKAKEALPDSIEVPEAVSSQMERMFRIPERVDLETLKKGLNDVALKGRDFAETMRNIEAREKLLPQIQERVLGNIRKFSPELAAKVDPSNPDSLIQAAREKDWGESLKVWSGHAADFAKASVGKYKNNLQELDQGMQGDLQKVLFDNLSDDTRDVQSVRDALPSIAQRMAAMAARNGDLDKGDVEAMTDLTDSMRSLFKDPQAVAQQFKAYVKNSDKSLLDKVLEIENARSDARQPNSFLELSLSPKARQSGWDIGQIAKYVDKAVLDPDNANYSILRNLFGSTAKANQVLDYYSEKAGVEQADEATAESDFEHRAAGINPLDLTEDEGPRYFFQNARAMTPFSANRLVKSKEGKTEFETEHARRKLAQVLKQAREAGGDVSGLRAKLVGYGEYAKSQGLDPEQRRAHFTKLATKRREDAIKKGKKLAAEGAPEEQLQQERRKVMQANRELKMLGLEGPAEDALNELYQVVRVDRAQNNTETFGSDQVYRMGAITRSRVRDEARRKANMSTKLSFIDTNGGHVDLSAESIAREAMRLPDRVINDETGVPQKYQQAFADGVAGLLAQGYKLAPGQDISKVVVHRASRTKALVEGVEAPPKRAYYPPSDATLDRVASARAYAARFKDRPFQLLEQMGAHHRELRGQLQEARGPRASVLKGRMRVTRELADNALRQAYPMPEAPETTGMSDEQLEDAKFQYLKELEDLARELGELEGHYDHAITQPYMKHVLTEIGRASEEETARKYEEDTGLAIGAEKGRNRARTSGDKEGAGPNPTPHKRLRPEGAVMRDAVQELKSRHDKKPISTPSPAPQQTASDERYGTPGRKVKHNMEDFFENNGSGESSASIEAQHRLRDEKAAGQKRVLIDRDGQVYELDGVDAVDTHARDGQIILQKGIGRGEWTMLSRGNDVSRDVAIGRAARAGMPLQVAYNSQTGSGTQTLDPQQQAALITEIQRQRGPDIKVLFEDFFNVGGSGSYTYDPATGERVIRIALQATSPLSVGRHEALHDFFTLLGGDKASQKMKDELLAAASSFPVMSQLRALLADHPAALKQIEADPEERLAYMYQFALNGQLRVGPKTGSIFAKIKEFLTKLLHTISSDDRALLYLGSLNAGHFADPNNMGAVAQAIQAQYKTYGDRMEAVSNLFGDVGAKLLSGATERLYDTKIGALREVSDAFHVDPDKEQPNGLPFLQRRQMARGVWQSRLFKVLEAHSAQELSDALTRLQAQKPDMSSPIDSAIRGLLDDMFDYLDKAGVKNVVRKQDQNGEWENVEEPLKKPKDYFPRLWDINGIRQNPQALIDAIVQHGGKTQKEAGRIVQGMIDGDVRMSVDQFDVNHVPWDQAVLQRKLDFINPGNAQHFTQFQEQNLGEILHTYVEQAIHRGEYARQFGNQGQWIKEKLEEAKAQGATPEDLKMATAAVKGLEGTLGLEMSPRLRQWMSGIITAENLILLPLSLFSQVVDAMAIGARSNSWKESFKALDAGFRAVAKSFTKNADPFSKDERLAMDLGILDETAMLEAMGMTYQGMYMTKRLRNINRKFFRINRMEQWNRAMRVQGMLAGQRFILANSKNARYMAELGLDEKDVVELPSGHMAVTEADGLTPAQARKVRTALFKFTDTAVLRPNAAHRPIWASDPRYMLLAHLKQFSFTFQNVILKNMKKELQYGNAKPLLVLMGAIPLIMVTDLLKNAMTGNLDTNMTFADALARGVARSGLLGTRAFYTDAYSDMTHGSLPGVSFLGPSFEHALVVAKGLLGTDGTDAVDVAVRSVPGGAVIRNLAQ